MGGMGATDPMMAAGMGAPVGSNSCPNPIPPTGAPIPMMAAGMGAPGGGMGIGQELEQIPDSPSNIGRLWEIQKIYSHLKAISGVIQKNTDGELIKLKKIVNEAIDIFDLVVSNFGIFKDRLDRIIIYYYKFIERLVRVIELYYHKKNKKDNKNEIRM